MNLISLRFWTWVFFVLFFLARGGGSQATSLWPGLSLVSSSCSSRKLRENHVKEVIHGEDCLYRVVNWAMQNSMALGFRSLLFFFTRGGDWSHAQPAAGRNGGGGALFSVWTALSTNPARDQGTIPHSSKGHRASQASPPRQGDNHGEDCLYRVGNWAMKNSSCVTYCCAESEV